MATGPTTVRQLIEKAYQSFNARNIDGALAAMHPDVDWPNGMEGGSVTGHAAVRDYWRRQWSAIDPVAQAVAFTTRPDGSIGVEVDQVTRSLDGTLLGEARVRHVYGFRDDLIARMDVEELPARAD